MMGKGWDSAAQYSFCIQRSLEGNPQFWWVKECLAKFPHPPQWEHVQRGPGGRYVSFPGGKGNSKESHLEYQLIKLAGELHG